MNSTKQVILRRSAGFPIIELIGDFSDSIEEDFRAAYAEACESSPKSIIIKFDSDADIYSSGIAVLISLIREAEKRKQKFHATGLSDHFAEVFDFTGLTRFVQIFPSEAQALAALKQNPQG